MGWVAGADGCKGGWFRAAREPLTGALHFALVPKASELLELEPKPRVLGIDVPIGLTERGPRVCDQLARRELGEPRRRSVFPAPVRRALRAKTQDEASDITERLDGRRVSAQAFAIYPKIGEVDVLLQTDHTARGILREVHPEVCFWAWSGGRALAAKKTAEGRSQRLVLAEQWLGPGILARARGGATRARLQEDDVLDAIAALWTALRIAEGRAQTLPDEPPADATGLPMEIVY